MILVDSSVWFDFFRDEDTGQTRLLSRFLEDDVTSVFVGDLVLMEVLQGATTDRAARLTEIRLGDLPQVRIADVPLVRTAARNYRILRDRGVTVRKTIDTLIATRCIVDDLALLYSDRDFDPFVEHLGLRSAMA